MCGFICENTTETIHWLSLCFSSTATDVQYILLWLILDPCGDVDKNSEILLVTYILWFIIKK